MYNIIKNKNMIIFLIFMVISFFVLIRYSDISVINLPFNLENIFIKPEKTNGIIYNLSIGYIVSSIFYLMLVYYPDLKRKEKVTKAALSDFATICTDAMLLIVLMYKNVCSKPEWDYKYLTDDCMFFDDNFYERMQRFDIYKTADTLLCHKEAPYEIITWDEKLQNDFEDFVNRIDITVNRYYYFLDDTIIGSALAFKNNVFIASYLGIPTNELGVSYTGENGIKYAERVPLHLILNDTSGSKKSAIFGVNNLCDNRMMLKSYIYALLALRKHCYNVTGFQKNRAVALFCHDECGQYGTAILDY